MMHFLGRWVAHCVQIVLMLTGAPLFMQLPRSHKGLPWHCYRSPQTPAATIISRRTPVTGRWALRPVEPSNAKTLDRSLSRAAMFLATHILIAQAPSLCRPLIAGWDALRLLWTSRRLDTDWLDYCSAVCLAMHCAKHLQRPCGGFDGRTPTVANVTRRNLTIEGFL
jgi:hypothetical protein